MLPTITPTPEPEPTQPTRRVHRPFFLWVLMLGLLALSIWNGLRLYGALHSWDWLQTLGVLPGAWYIAVSGGFFMLAFLAAFVTLLLRLRPAGWITRAVVLPYALWYWLDRLLLTRSGNEIGNTLFAAGMTILMLGFSLAALKAWQDMQRG